MYRCVLNQAGELRLHQHRQAGPDPFLTALAPDREDLGVWVECLFTWDWRADLCAREGLPFVLGHARALQAIHGGKAKHATIDSPKMAVWLRGGLRPQAYVYPAERRATRDLLRRRMHLMRTRAERLAHLQQTTSQSNLPDLGKQLADKANRDGVAERFPEPAVQQRMAVDLALINHDDGLRGDLERSLLKTATPPHAHTRSLRRTVPGLGALLSLVLRDALQAIGRFPRVQAFGSSGRLVKCTQASAGKRSGTSGPTSGHASLPWAFSDAAVLCRRTNPADQQYRTTRQKTPGPGNA
jgi:transposase